MSPEEHRLRENSALRAQLTQLERLGNDYADLMLMDAVAHVEMENIRGGFTLPAAAYEVFADLKVATPKSIEAVNLDIRYERGRQRFSILRGAVDFDNNYVVAFSPPRAEQSDEGITHDIDIFTIGDSGMRFIRRIEPTSNQHVQRFFTACGITIPEARERASWDAIIPTLTSAEQRIVTAKHAAYFTPVHELIVSEQTFYGTIPGDDTILHEQQSAWLQRSPKKPVDPVQAKPEPDALWLSELSLQVVNHDPVAAKVVEIVMRSESQIQKPDFYGIFLHEEPRNIQRPVNLSLSSKNITGLAPLEGAVVTIPVDLSQYAAFVTQAILAASGGMLG